MQTRREHRAYPPVICEVRATLSARKGPAEYVSGFMKWTTKDHESKTHFIFLFELGGNYAERQMLNLAAGLSVHSVFLSSLRTRVSLYTEGHCGRT